MFDCGLRDIRQSLGLSLRDVAKAVGRSDACIYDIEQGTDLQLTTALALAEFFGKPIGEIWKAQ